MGAFPGSLEALQPFWDEWVLDAFLGKGRHARVYRIRRQTLGGALYGALKWISLPVDAEDLRLEYPEGMGDASIEAYDAGLAQELQREIDWMKSLGDCPHIVQCRNHLLRRRDHSPGWDILIAMDLLQPLPERFGQGMTVGDVIDLGADICTALETCHGARVIHGDIKPANLFADPSGRYLLGDFGVVQSMDAPLAAPGPWGTPAYAAPEVFRQNAAYGPAVDLYSLGLVLYRYLNRQQLPFLPPEGSLPTPDEVNAAIIHRLDGNALPPPGQGGPALERVILKACAPNPQNRYSVAAEMRAALLSAKQSTPLSQPL